MVFSTKRNKPDHPTLFMNNVEIDDVSVYEHLGLTLSSDFSWRPHIYQKASKKLNILKPLKYKLSRYALDVLDKSLVRSTLEYAVVWDGCSTTDSDLLESFQIESARLVTAASKGYK